MKFIEFAFDQETWSLIIQVNVWVILIAAIGSLLLRFFLKQRSNKPVMDQVTSITMKYKVGALATEYKIERNHQNIEIAHRIYIELITRKAAIKIDEKQDVIVEVYNSWYSLFQITRDELKTMDGELLTKNQHSSQLIKLLTDILNESLRPHLTEYQAKFRKWYDHEIEEETDESPQEIQARYPEYAALIDSMKGVNDTLMSYAKQLKDFITDKEG